MPPKKKNNMRKVNNGKQSKGPNRPSERPMSSAKNTDLSSGPESTDAQSSSPERAQAQSPHDSSMTDQSTNPGQPSADCVTNTSMDGREWSGDELSPVNRHTSNDGPPSDDDKSSTDGQDISLTEESANAACSFDDVQSSVEEPPMVHCMSLEGRVENGKQSKGPNRPSERPMSSANNTDLSSGPESTDAQSSSPERAQAQSLDIHDSSMPTNPGQPSADVANTSTADVTNTSMDGREPSGDELSPVNGHTSPLIEQLANDGPPSDDDKSSTDGRDMSLTERSANGACSFGDVQSSVDHKEPPMVHCRYLEGRVETVELNNKQAEGVIGCLKGQLADQEKAINDLTKEVHALRTVSGDMDRARKKYKDEVTILAEVHEDKLIKLKAEFDRDLNAMKTQHESDIHAKEAEVIRVEDKAIRREAQMRDEQRARLEGDMRTITELLGGLHRKFDERIGDVEKLIAEEVIPAVRNTDLSITTLDGKVGDLKKLVEDTREEAKQNHPVLTNMLVGVVAEVGNVRKMVDGLNQDGRKQHEEMKRGVDNAVVEIGKTVDISMNIMLEKGREQNKELQQTIAMQSLNNGIGPRLASLAEAVQAGNENHKIALHEVDNNVQKNIESLSQDLRRGSDRNREEFTESMKKLQQWIENLSFKAEKTQIVKICRA